MTLRGPRSSEGFTYIAALVMVVIMGIMLGQAATSWKTIMQREREVELLYRGTEYRNAMRRFYGMPIDASAVAVPPGTTTPPALPTALPTTLPNGQLNELKDLLQSSAAAGKKRFLRKLYLDPMTGKAFDVVKDSNQRIIGVKSTSEAEPIRQSTKWDFPLDLEPSDFEGKKKYSEWQFICIHYPQPASAGGVQGLPPSTGQTPAPTPTQ